MNREQAFAIMNNYIKAEHLVKHSSAVEICMRAYAQHFGQDADYWGNVGLLHDIDFDLYPQEHLQHTEEILAKEGLDSTFIENVLSHNRQWPHERTLIQKTLLAVDEMPGFVIACTLVRPDKDINNLEVKSVVKKFKDKAFARAVNRDTMRESAAALGVDLNEHISFVINALKQAKDHPVLGQVNLY